MLVLGVCLRVCGFVYYSSLRADGSAEFVILVVLDCERGVVCMMVVSLAAVSGVVVLQVLMVGFTWRCGFVW